MDSILAAAQAGIILDKTTQIAPKVVVPPTTAASLQVEVGRRFGGDMVTCDWHGTNSQGPRWSMTEQEYCGRSWLPTGDKYPDGRLGRLDEIGRQILIAHFKLERIADRLPRDVIEVMSRFDLMRELRALEALHSEERTEIFVRPYYGGDIPAEQCD